MRVILCEDDVVAVDKPAGMPTIADHDGAAHALIAATARALEVDPGRLHPTSRLDRGVSGVVVFALTKAAAQRLARARAEGGYERRYVAIAARAPVPANGTWDAPLGRARDPRLRMVHGRDAVAAATRYGICADRPGRRGGARGVARSRAGRTRSACTRATQARRSWAIATTAGRRASRCRRAACSSRGAWRSTPRASWSPARAGRLSWHAPVPPELEQLWSALGGEAEAWELATSCVLP